MKPLQCKDCIFHVFLVVGTLLYRQKQQLRSVNWSSGIQNHTMAKTTVSKNSLVQLITKYFKKKRIGPKSSSSITFYFLSNQQKHLGNSNKIAYDSSYQGLLISDNSPSKTKKNLQQTTHSCYQLKHSHLPSLQIES